MTTRSDKSGQKALSQLKDEEIENQNVNICYMILDLTDSKSIESFSNEFRTQFGQYDILINNAGIANELSNENENKIDNLVKTVETNYIGTRQVLLKSYRMTHTL